MWLKFGEQVIPNQKLKDVFTKIAELNSLVPEEVYPDSMKIFFKESLHKVYISNSIDITFFRSSDLGSVSRFERAVKELEAFEERQGLLHDRAGKKVSDATLESGRVVPDSGRDHG